MRNVYRLAVIASILTLAAAPASQAALLDDLLSVIGCIFTPACDTRDLNGDQAVTVADAVEAVIQGSAPGEQPTRTPTGPATSPTATATVAQASPTATATTPVITPGSVSERVAGGTTVVVNGMGVVSSIVTAIASGFQFGGSTGAASALITSPYTGNAAGDCPLGGTATRSGSFPPAMTITLNQCGVPTTQGSVILTGAVSVTGLFTITANVDIDVTFRNQQQETVLTASADLTGTVTGIQPAQTCFLLGATLRLTGPVEAQVPGDGGVRIQFSDTIVNVVIKQFSADCVPLRYTLTFNGPATVTETSSGQTYAVTFVQLSLDQNAGLNPAEATLNGGIASTCFGGNVTLATDAPIKTVVGDFCPLGGSIVVTAAPGQSGKVFYSPGGVDIDSDLNGTTDVHYDFCLAPELLACPQ